MAIGLFYLLLLGSALVALFFYLPRHVSQKILLTVALLGTGVLLATVLRSLLYEGLRPPAWVLLFLLFIALTLVLVWLVQRLARATPHTVAPGDGRNACPPIGSLKDLLAERLRPAEQARLAAHLELCPACQHRVEGLTAGQRSWPGMAHKLSDRPPAPEPALRKVIDRLKQNPQEATQDEPAFAADLPLGFLSPADKPGQLGRLERYEVLEEIGRGGMGVVLKAFDPSLHRVVAIKVLAPQLATSGVARKRFLREAKAAAAVSHDHIVTIHAVDQANGLPYLVMQYVAGQSLQQRIDKDGPLELTDVLRIGMQTASGLAAAHGHGIVHRDIKPANILLEEGVQRVKITDFGLARAMDDASLTQSGFLAGSPLYMAPEQARGESLDYRADLFSLGSVLYTMCTGRPPFRAANTLAVLRRVSEDTPRPVRETNPEVPEWLVAVVDKLLAKDPADRYQSAAEVVEVLGRQLAQLQGASWTPPPAAGKPEPEPGLPTSVTFCPSCGTSLHVPEHMVGTVVHCAECGKPFRAEETSEVIQVARPVKAPLGPAFRRRRKVPRWVWAVCGCVALFLLLWFALSLSVRRQRAEVRALEALRAATESRLTSGAKAAPAARAATKLESAPPPGDLFWQNALSWLPPEATCFGAIDVRPFGSLALDDPHTQALLRLLAPRKTAERLTPENLGRIRFDGVAGAFYEGTKPGDARLILHLEGLALDGRRPILDFLRRQTGDKLRIDENDQVIGAKPIGVSGPALPFALGIYDDNHAHLACAGGADAEADQHRKVLEKVPAFNFSNARLPAGNVLSGYNPPWLRNALNEVPRDACGLFAGDIPADLRKVLTEEFKLRACPRSFFCVLTKRGSGVSVSLTLNVDKAGADLLLAQDLEQWRRRALEMWRSRYPALDKEPEALALVGHPLQTMRWGANPASRCVRTNVDVSAKTWDALLKLLGRASQ
jgi:serine/threonine-protein kinase